MTRKEILKRLLYLALSIVIGIALYVPLLFIWFYITSTVLGYGDGAPRWAMAITDWIPIVTIIGSAIGSQILFQYVFKKDGCNSYPLKDTNSYTSKYLYHLFATLIALLLGLFLGLYLFPNIFRATIDMLGYANSDVSWLLAIFIFISIMIFIICIYYSNKLMKNYLSKKNDEYKKAN